MFRIQYLPEHEKAQVQDFRNWVQSDPDSTTRSAPESLIIGLIESSTAAACQEAGTSGTSIPRPHPSAATGETTTTTAGIGSGEAEGSRNPTVRVVPFQSLPQSAQEELGKELFDDSLLTVENVKKLADYMQWSFKFTKVRLLLSFLY